MNEYEWGIGPTSGTIKADNIREAIIEALKDYMGDTEPPYLEDSAYIELRISLKR